MVIWLRAGKEFADNRFQLLFIYIDKDRLYILRIIFYYYRSTLLLLCNIILYYRSKYILSHVL